MLKEGHSVKRRAFATPKCLRKVNENLDDGDVSLYLNVLYFLYYKITLLKIK